ncbi:acyl-CoA dehydrogenase family protein [Streptomyces sp. NPDC056660]|uniref:acyl-CoA dehydrogenase family protein n=1 Tax=Streptomyces sp. NPDC056660 TaxID=3345897 RepID=UPI003682F572
MTIEEYRAALAAYLDGEPALQRWRGQHYATVPEQLAAHAELIRLLYDGGWNRHGWPVAAGGLGGDERYRAVLYDELSARDLPVPGPHLLLETLGPAVTHFAPHLAATYLPRFLSGEEWWGQGFSEPEAGSDLAALRSRARRENDHYVLNGQKLWTSYGFGAARLVCLVRTGTTESRHRGLSMIMVDADAPGVTVRPIALASGRAELAEVFLDDVRVPADRLVGAEGQGWAVAMHLLQWERGMYAWLSSTVLLSRLRALRDRLVSRASLSDGTARRLGQVYLDVVALRSRSASTVRRLAVGETIGPEASVDKILLATAEQGVYDAARDLLAPSVDVGGDVSAADWRAEWWYSRAATILGGSAEVQRGILADRVLALPGERS